MKKQAVMKEEQMVHKESEEMETIQEESLDLKIMGNPNHKNSFVHSNEEIFYSDVLAHVEWEAKGKVTCEGCSWLSSPVTRQKREGRAQSKVIGVINWEE